MIAREDIKPGDRIIQSDYDELIDFPHRGTVFEIQDIGSGPYDYVALIDLDEESMQDPYVAASCPDGVMVCHPWMIDLITE